MKNFLAIIMVVVLSLFMSACTNENNVPADGYVEYYEEYDENVANSSESETQNPSEELLDVVLGEWVKCEGDETQYQTISIKDDNIIQIDGKTYKWVIDNKFTTVDRIYLDVFDGTDEFVELKLSHNRDYNNEKDGTYEIKYGGTDDYFCNKSDFEIIEITTENFFDYFEFGDILKADKLDNGLYTDSPEYKCGWVLKDGLKAELERTNIEFQCSYNSSYRDIEYDVKTAKHTISDVKTVYDYVYNVEDDLSIINGELIAEAGITSIMKLSDGKFTISSYPENLKLKSATGVLYLYK